MILYYSPGACSLGVHIALRELGVKFELEKVDLKSKTFSGGDYWKVNPKGSVPALRLDDGEILTEANVILRYLADHAPEGEVSPRSGTMANWRMQEWLNFVSTDLHKGFTPLFGADGWVENQKGRDQLRKSVSAVLKRKYELIATQMAEFLAGDAFTVADGYLFLTLRWARAHRVELPSKLTEYFERMRERPSVHAALVAEGLAK